tara:strand:- start:4067 stop:5017 length:951 start_codon:yes stop_codon:yes gene_type:complete
MIGIKGIASHIPEDAIDNILQGKGFGETEDFIHTKIGAAKLPRMKPDQDTSDLACLAVSALFEKYPDLSADKVDALVLVTQNPDGQGLPHTAAIIQHKLGLPPHVSAFDVSLGCSGFVYGLYIVKGLLEASGLQNGVLVTCDPYSKVIRKGDRVTNLLFGDAATATWIGEQPKWRLGGVSYATDGAGAEHLMVANGALNMNGRQIFNFAATRVAPHIEELLRRQGIAPDEIDLYCLHQGSAAIISAISRKFPEIEDRFVLDLTDTGNTVSSSIPLLLEKHAFKDGPKRILMCGFGVGLSMASAIIFREENYDRNVD